MDSSVSHNETTSQSCQPPKLDQSLEPEDAHLNVDVFDGETNPHPESCLPSRTEQSVQKMDFCQSVRHTVSDKKTSQSILPPSTDQSSQSMNTNLMQSLMAENEKLKKEAEELKKEQAANVYANSLLKEEVKRLQQSQNNSTDTMSFSKISPKDKLVKHFTGLPNKETFYALLKLCDGVEIEYLYKWKVTQLSREDQLFLTLLKLRRNLSHLDLSMRFNKSVTTITNVFVSWLLLLHHVLVEDLMSSVPSREKNQVHLPECFASFEDTRIILDCTEVTTANPSLLSNQKSMFSNYKHKITSKGLIGISPNGVVTFASKLYAGNTSDKSVVSDCGILNCLVPGDAVMVDKGFLISDILPEGVKLYIPPFKENPQFTLEQINETFAIAQARIHVERAICRIKRFQILNFIPHYVAPYASEIFQLCSFLTNFQGALLQC